MLRRTAAAATLVMAAAAPIAAQDLSPSSPAPKQVISINPLLAVGGFYTAEFERAVSSSVTVALGGSYWSTENDNDESLGYSSRVTYSSSDLKLRFYPGGQALKGFSIAGLVGYTRAVARDRYPDPDGSGTLEDKADVGAVAVGTQLDYSWLLGAKQNFSVGLGIGAKRLLFVEENEDDDFSLTIPTLRISVGIAF